jgi:hypothetical protein
MSGNGAKVVFVVVGDTGPAEEIGEGSAALNGALLGRSGEPANYLEIRGKPPFEGRG